MATVHNLPQPTWHASLTQGARGIDPSPGNVELYLAHDPAWKDCLAFDEMQMRPVWTASPPVCPGHVAPAPGTLVEETDWVLVQAWFRPIAGVVFPERACGVGIDRAARRRRVHAVRDYLDTLTWDGTPRLETWLTMYLGVPQTVYTAAVSAATLIGAVARVRRPGCKVDTMLILEGGQGVGKSRALRALAVRDEFFDDSLPDLRDKDAMIHLRALWILEVAELDAFKGAENSRVKAFLSKQVDRFRPPFARTEITAPRSNVFIGTTNGTQYLQDATGARRFLPVRVGERIDVDGLARDRDQLWAEAQVRYAAGAPWHLDATVEVEAREQQEERFLADPWEDLLRDKLEGPRGLEVTVLECLELLKVPAATLRGLEGKRVAGILTRLGYRKQRLGPRDDRRWVWVRRVP